MDLGKRSTAVYALQKDSVLKVHAEPSQSRHQRGLWHSQIGMMSIVASPTLSSITAASTKGCLLHFAMCHLASLDRAASFDAPLEELGHKLRLIMPSAVQPIRSLAAARRIVADAALARSGPEQSGRACDRQQPPH